MMKNTLIILLMLALGGCVSRKAVLPSRLPASQLLSDYDLFRNILEESHPGLYWYTSRDSMNFYFDKGRSMIRDSMNHQQFRLVLNYVIAQIRCGHTSSRLPKNFPTRDTSLPVFPLQLKLWGDTAIITQNISRQDSVIRRGYLLNAIEGQSMKAITDSLFTYLSTDGYNETHKYQTLSNRSVFGSLYTSVYGNKKEYAISYTDSAGKTFETKIHSYVAPPDTGRRPPRPTPVISKRERREQSMRALRYFSIDTALNTGIMELNTFTKNAKLRRFFRQSFKKMRKDDIENLVIDLRSNGGGSVTYSNLLTKYISKSPFKIADSLYAINRYTSYGRYRQHSFFNSLFLIFMTHKLEDGNYHFRYFENRFFKPKTRNHFDGNVYLLSGGNTYSASTLVITSLKRQENVIPVGEETGGGEYGNNAWLIPDITLPNSRLRFRLPLFRLVIDKNLPKGYGVAPEVLALPTVNAIRKNLDFKMDAAKELIRLKRSR